MDNMQNQPETQDQVLVDNINDGEFENYAKNFSEYEELKKIENEVNNATSELDDAKKQLLSIETEIKTVREEEKVKLKKIELLFNQAKEKEVEGLYDDALDLFLEIIEINPSHARSLSHIDRIKDVLAQKEKERVDKELEAKRKTKETMELFESAKRFYREGNYEKALDDLNIAISFGGKNPEIVNYKENCELRIAEIDEAMNKAKRESEEKKRLINEYSLAANAHFRDEEYDQGIKLLEKALLIMPDNKEIQESLSSIEIKYKENRGKILKEKAEIKNRLKKVREHQFKAFNLAKNNDYESAIQELEKVLFIDPTDNDSLSDIKVYQQNLLQQKKEQLLRKERISKEKHDKDNMIKENYGKGVSFFTINDYENAALSFSQVLAVDPHYEDVENYMHRIEERVKEQDQKSKEFKIKELESNERLKVLSFEEEKQKQDKMNDLFEYGLRLIAKKDFQGAVLKFEKCFSLDNTNEVYLRELEKARLLEQEKHEEELKKEQYQQEIFDKEKEKQIKIEMLIKKAENLFKNEFLNKAKEVYEDILELEVDNKPALQGLISTQDKMKELELNAIKMEEEKKSVLNSIKKMIFDAKGYIEEKEYDKAIDVSEKVLDLDADNTDAKTNILIAKKKRSDINDYQKLKVEIITAIDQKIQQISAVKQVVLDCDKIILNGSIEDALVNLNDVHKRMIDQEL